MSLLTISMPALSPQTGQAGLTRHAAAACHVRLPSVLPCLPTDSLLDRRARVAGAAALLSTTLASTPAWRRSGQMPMPGVNRALVFGEGLRLSPVRRRAAGRPGLQQADPRSLARTPGPPARACGGREPSLI
jgi:hypothetical protein